MVTPLLILLGGLLLVAVVFRRAPLRTLLLLGSVVAAAHFHVVAVPPAIRSRVTTLEGVANFNSATCVMRSLMAGATAGSAISDCHTGGPAIPPAGELSHLPAGF